MTAQQSKKRERPEIPAALEAICLQCLAKDPDARYASVEALADDLARFAGGEQVQAGAPARRSRGSWLAGAALAAIALAAVGVAALRTTPPPEHAESGSSAQILANLAREREAKATEVLAAKTREREVKATLALADLEAVPQDQRDASARVTSLRAWLTNNPDHPQRAHAHELLAQAVRETPRLVIDHPQALAAFVDDERFVTCGYANVSLREAKEGKRIRGWALGTGWTISVVAISPDKR